MPSIIKVDQIQSDQGFVNVSSNLQFSSGFTMLSPTFTGQATIPTINLTGGQIKFPATQVPSSDGNTLDDYEEGTWTGTLQGVGSNPNTPVTATGSYTKIGRQVFARLTYVNVNTTGASGQFYIIGLPFASAQALATGDVMTYSIITATSASINLSPYVESTNIYLYYMQSADIWAPATHNAGSGRYLQISVIYEV